MSSDGQLPIDSDIPISKTDPANTTSSEVPEDWTEADWLGLASSNFTTARAFQDSGVIVQWERNADHFNSKHFRRSAYNTPLYRGRSRLFRPLTRASERASSAQFAQAMFSNIELVSVTPKNINDDMQLMSARMMKNILQDRLRNTIPWYLTAMGAFQDTRVYGPCYTYLHWDYADETIKKKSPVYDLKGNVMEDRSETVEETVVLWDKPVIDMVPPENILLDPACDWRDPIGTSPYVVRLVPMYVTDIEKRMGTINPKTERPVWKEYSREEMLSVGKDAYNTVRQAREGDNRQDKTDAQEYEEFQLVWCHENFVRVHGMEWVYWTLGTQFLLSDPVPLSEAYLAGVRPIAAGFSVIETHKFLPSSATELIASVQASVNDIANLRIDNVRLALNKRYIIRRGAVVDLEALMRSVPGGGIMTENVEQDIKVIETRDVTSSSYKEQERLDTEADDVSGAFRGGSIQNNRSLNETVGGMEMLAEGSNAISEMDIRTFTETWCKAQLKLLMLYIQAYETDAVIYNNAYEEAAKEFNFLEGQDEMSVQQIKQKLFKMVRSDALVLDINVGLGATSPQRKAEMMTQAIRTVSQTDEQIEKINWDEVTKEMFATFGFQDGSRFIKAADDEQKITEEDLQAAQQEGMQAGQDQIKMEEIAMRERVAQQEIEAKAIDKEKDRQLDLQKHKESLDMKMKLETMKDQTRRDEAAIREGNKANELGFKERTGEQGI